MVSGKVKNTTIKQKSNLMYWTRFSLAILSAVLCAFLKLGIEGIAVGLSIYLISYVLARYLVMFDIDLGKYGTYMLGSGTYFVTWFTFWILLYTLFSSVS